MSSRKGKINAAIIALVAKKIISLLIYANEAHGELPVASKKRGFVSTTLSKQSR